MTQPSSLDNPLLAELQWVHNMLRRDLAVIRELADAAADGAPSRQIQAGVQDLQSRGPLFQLKVNCLNYCQLVHHHHRAEDAMLFPAVRQSAPHLSAVVDKLEADHLAVSDLLRQVEDHALQLSDVEAEVRLSLVFALRSLSDYLLEHLEFEEANLAPVLASWQSWPFWS